MGFGGFGGFFRSVVRVAKSALSNAFSPTSFLSGFNPLSFITSIALNMAVSVTFQRSSVKRSRVRSPHSSSKPKTVTLLHGVVPNAVALSTVK